MLATWAAAGCSGGAPSVPAASRAVPRAVEAAGLHNVYRLNDRLYSGSSPEGDEGFASLRGLGVRTVISVDGARPDLERARRFGLRYVHLPVGYDGVPEAQALRLARAVRDLPGPVYIHCHHGRHRGPAAAAVVLRYLDESCGADAAVAWMKQAGTDPRYAGLYAAPRRLRRPTSEELDRVPDDFPEAAEVAALAQLMVGVDERWENVKRVKAAGWKVPPAHPDLDPPHEALQLAELYREAARLPEVNSRPEEFRQWLRDAEEGATDLERALRQGKPDRAVDGAKVEAAFEKATACSRCHAKYRDVPQGP
jgi:protein tyrosine phosphatase (PTP) superfamily phosphohydrolase (DUF442 family)